MPEWAVRVREHYFRSPLCVFLSSFVFTLLPPDRTNFHNPLCSCAVPVRIQFILLSKNRPHTFFSSHPPQHCTTAALESSFALLVRPRPTLLSPFSHPPLTHLPSFSHPSLTLLSHFSHSLRQLSNSHTLPSRLSRSSSRIVR